MPDRRDRRLALGMAAMLAVAIAVLLGPALVGDDVLIATDQLLLKGPWRDELAREGTSTSAAPASDTFDLWEPQRQLFAEAVTGGDLALWNPYPSGGAPLGAEPSTGTLSPFQLVYVLLPDSYAPGLVKLLELVASAGFTFLFLRAVGLGRVAAVTGGMIYAFNGFQLVWTNWPQARLGAVVPGLFWAVERLLQRRTPANVALVAVIVAVLVVEGFPAVGLAVLIAAMAYVVVRVAMTPSLRSGWRGWLRAVGPTAGGLAVGVGLAAVQLLPFLARLPHLTLDHRHQSPGDHLDSVAAVTLAAPNALGAPQEGVVHLPRGFVDYVEALSYVGAAACVLALVGLVGPSLASGAARLRPGVRLFAAMAAAVTFVLMFVGGPLLAVAQQFPPLDMNYVGRLRVLLALFVAVLAAFGVESLTSSAASGSPAGPTPDPPASTERAGDGDRTGRWVLRPGAIAWVRSDEGRRLLGWAVVVGAVLGGLALLVRVVLVASDGGYLPAARDDLLAAGVVAVGALGAVLAARRWPARRGLAILVLGALVVGQGLTAWRTYLPSSESSTYFPDTEMHRFLQDNLGHDRAATADWTLIAGSTARYRIRTVTGDVFTQPTWQDLLEAVDPEAFSRSPNYSFLASTAEVATSPILDRLGARHFVTSEDADVLGVATPVTAAGAPATAVTGVAAGPATSEVVLGPRDRVATGLRAQRLRGVIVGLVEPVVTGDPRAWLEVEVRDGEGTVVGRGSRRILQQLGPGEVTIPVAAEGATFDAPEDLTITISLAADDGQATLAASGGGAPAIGTVTGDDDLELVFSSHGQVYERSRALPRVRWADQARYVPESGERVQLLRAGIPDDTVLVEDPEAVVSGGGADRGASGGAEQEAAVAGDRRGQGAVAGGGTAGDGRPADVEVVEDGLGRVRVEVDAPQAGYLVLADAVQIGWRAELDGEPVELHRADHALGAVVVPAGRHVVDFGFQPDGFRLGRAVTGASLVVVVLLVAPALARLPPGRRRHDV